MPDWSLKGDNMGIAGLSTYSSSSYYFAMSNKGKSEGTNTEAVFGLLSGKNDNKDTAELTANSTDVAMPSVPYTRCIMANIKTEEVYVAKSEDGEMIYSYKASEQSFKIWINSDGENKTYSVEGIDSNGEPFTKEFNPYEIDPEDADFPEFAALCMYIRNTDETADMLANDYFNTDDILEKCNYLDKLQGFAENPLFEKAQAMLDNANRLLASLNQIVSMRNDIDSFFNPFFTQYLVDDIDIENYPDVAGKISEELSSGEIKEDTKVEETVTPLGIGFALAGNMGYGMSASLIEKPGCDDTIIRVKIATGGEDEFVDVNLSNFDPKNATPVEMFAYCEYMDSIGEGVNSKWGSWSALKMVMSPLDGSNFGSLENIMNKKMNWTDALSKAETSLMDSHTLEIKLTPADLIKMLEESHRITAQELKEDDDWRKMSDEEWDKLIEDVDKYIDAFKERVKQMKEAQEESAKKAAMEADADMKTVAASQAATEAASGFGGSDSSEDSGVDHENNWTKKLNTDDQTILMTAKEAQKMEKNAMSKFEEIQETDNTSTGVSSVNGVTECASASEDENKDKIWTITAYSSDGITSKRFKNGVELDGWELKYKNPSDGRKVLDFISSFEKDADLKFAGSKEFWEEFLAGKVSKSELINADNVWDWNN